MRAPVHRQGTRRCDDRCMGAKGPDCSCRCGGTNHGISYIPHRHYGDDPEMVLDAELATAPAVRTARRVPIQQTRYHRQPVAQTSFLLVLVAETLTII